MSIIINSVKGVIELFGPEAGGNHDRSPIFESSRGEWSDLRRLNDSGVVGDEAGPGF